MNASQEQLVSRIREIRRELDAIAGRDAVTLCAVTKTVPAEIVNRVYGAGVRIIGENRVQEAMEKLPRLNPDFALHMIGQLQTNKVKYLMNSAAMIQSVDRLALAREIDRRAQAAGRRVDALVEINVAHEPQKGGVPTEELEELLRAIAPMQGLRVRGLMAVMPAAADPENVRPFFREARGWFDRMRELGIEGIAMETLSMGMSHDWRVAAQEGATMVRIGSGIFGPREPVGADPFRR